MGKNNDEEYDWLNDPFDEKKAAEERERYGGMTGASKAVVAICLVLFVLGFILMLGLLVVGIL